MAKNTDFLMGVIKVHYWYLSLILPNMGNNYVLTKVLGSNVYNPGSKWE